MKSKISKMPDVLYHGTTDEDENEIKRGIDLQRGRPKLDFGKGFYTTSNYGQASRWAKTKASNINIERKFISGDDKNIKIVRPKIMKFNVNVEKLEKLNGIIFDNPDEKWAKFVLENRLGEYNVDGIDYVYGDLADSRIATPIRKFKKHEIDFKQFYKEIYPSNPKMEDQLCFLTDEAIKCLERE